MRQSWKFRTSFPGSDYVQIEVTQGEPYCDEIWTTPLIVKVNGVDITYGDWPYGLNMWTAPEGDQLSRLTSAYHAVAIHARRIGYVALEQWAESRMERVYAVERAFFKAWPVPADDPDLSWLSDFTDEVAF